MSFVRACDASSASHDSNGVDAGAATQPLDTSGSLEPQNAGPVPACTESSLQLPELVLQILFRTDARTLTAAVPLVCRAWNALADDPTIWLPRLDPGLVAACSQACRQLPSSIHASMASGCPSPLLHRYHPSPWDQTVVALAVNSGAGGTSTSSSSSGAGGLRALPARPPRLSLLHHAVYAMNLLRDPCFTEAPSADKDYGQQLLRLSGVLSERLRRGGGAGGGASGTSRGGGSPGGGGGGRLGGRRAAWVPTDQSRDGLAWQYPPTGLHRSCPPPPQPLPQHGRRQQHPPGPSGSISSSSAKLAPARVPGATTCLATSGYWGEVVQVVDVAAELQQRGLSLPAAEAVLDAGLVLRLAVWVAAPCSASDAGGDVAAAGGSCAGSGGGGGGGAAAAASGGGITVAGGSCGGGSPCRAADAQFAVCLILDDGQTELKSFQAFVRRPSSYHFFSRRLCAPSGHWHRYMHLVGSCPRGFRRAVVLLRGRGLPELPGICGAKFTAAELAFVPRSAIDGASTDACWGSWQEPRGS